MKGYNGQPDWNKLRAVKLLFKKIIDDYGYYTQKRRFNKPI
jgi:hypothetical protein